MRLVFDIDGTICSQVCDTKYENAKPFYDMIEFVNNLYNDGHYIIYFTARGMGTNKGAITKVYEEWFLITKSQLDNWGVKYNELVLGKPHADMYIDDKGVRFSDLDKLKKFIYKDFKNEYKKK